MKIIYRILSLVKMPSWDFEKNEEETYYDL